MVIYLQGVCPKHFHFCIQIRSQSNLVDYPHIFQEADICVINKIDLAPYLNTKVEVLRENALKVNHHLQIFEVSATKGDGMDAWCDWLQTESAKCK